MTDQPAECDQGRWPLFWFWGIYLALIIVGDDTKGVFLGVIGTAAALPAVVASVSAFTHPEWFKRKQNQIFQAILWVGGSLVYWILVNTGHSVRWIDGYRREGHDGAEPMIAHLTTRLIQEWDWFNSAFVIVLVAFTYLFLFIWLRGTPLSQVGRYTPPASTTTDTQTPAA